MDINTNETELKLDKNDQVKKIIELYCELNRLAKNNNNNYYLTKIDLNKLDENITIKEAKILNNQTLYIFEGNKIEFIINYKEKEFQIKGNDKMKFEECIKSFINENGNENLFFSLNGEQIDISKELNQLGIKNNDVVKAEQI